MTSFGAQLRSTRIAKDWSIEYVSFKSKIQPNIIVDLEADDFTQFTSSSYVKSFLRKYSEFLELDFEDEISEMEVVGFANFETLVCEGVKENLETAEFSVKDQRYRKAEKSKGSPVFLVGAVVVLLSTLAGFYYMGSQANFAEGDARDIVNQFESQEWSFSREKEPKERLIGEKQPIPTLKTAETSNAPLASTRVTSVSRLVESIDPTDSTDQTDLIKKPDLRTIRVPELDSAPDKSSSKPQVKLGEVNPMFDY
jgi:cytoskeletal protein RodZ